MSGPEPRVTVSGPVSFERDLCKACGICIDLCPTDVFDRDEMGYPVVARPGDCTACLLCELHCPDFALEIARGRRKRRSAAGEAGDVERVKVAVAGAHGADDAQCGTHGEED